ncbi:cytoplasmic 60S subunit biogenesis factor REI1 homolog 1 [Olea europaea subsp. europaea]|uniref:Cytoplasmic 60S subunit biogenesis factor REI1 homolog 1 n=1 Tax=Olea europaea subsp. europaea TaxID=158383 RepID=A0A8S0TQV3_OLEEU|nr:cytoplasmic 60S subunit biogenesis factor REI1 homolog 1 [Olea europaea subsp. europaea]
MPGLTCNACNKEFQDDADQKIHYKSEWHRYNLKRKVAGVPGVTESLFLARQSALAEEKKKLDETPLMYSCGLCGKGYRSSKAHAQHLQSKSHLMRASEGTSNNEGATIIKPLARRVARESPPHVEQEVEESEESEWEEVDEEDDLVGEAADSLTQLKVNEHNSNDTMDADGMDDDEELLDASCCFMCDLQHDTIESCMVHMHKQHGFFIPDVEYLKDPRGLLTYLGLKVKRDFMCLYCNDRCHPFSSLEAVRKHMEAKSHCKVHYGDGGEDEEAELEEFYDYSSSYVDTDGKQLIAVDDTSNTVELGSGGSELVITRRNDGAISTRMLGSREYLRYYRQKLRPTPANNIAIAAALASRYKSMGLATVQSREHMVRLKVMKAMTKTGVEAMRSKIGMKSNVIRNLPKNVPY